MCRMSLKKVVDLTGCSSLSRGMYVKETEVEIAKLI